MNFCHEQCNHSLLKKDSKGVIQGRNTSEFCDLGYKQSVNSFKAKANAEMNGTIICAKLRGKFRNDSATQIVLED